MVPGCNVFKLAKSSKTFCRSISANTVLKCNHCITEKKENEGHIYKKIMTREETVEFLTENVLYKKDNVIAVNKPYGLGFQRPKTVNEHASIPHFIDKTDNNIHFEDVLPALAENLGFNSLSVVKAPSRFASGVMILAVTEETKLKVQKLFQAGLANNMLLDTYLVITIGHPKQKVETEFFLKQEEGFIPVLLTQCTKSKRKREYIRRFIWKHDVLAKSEFGSLVKVNISRSRNNILKFYLGAQCLAPILGDLVYGAKIGKVFGIPFFVENPSPSALYDLYDSKLQAALQVSQDEIEIIPSHVHLLSVNLPIDKKSYVFVSAPPPESFQWTCEKLQLPMGTSLLCENNK